MTISTSIDDQQAGTSVQMVVSGDILLGETPALRDRLVEAICGHEAVEVVLDQVTRVDVSLFQLLCSAHHSAVEAGKVFRVNARNGEQYAEWLELIGLRRHVGCDKDICASCIWIGGPRI